MLKIGDLVRYKNNQDRIGLIVDVYIKPPSTDSFFMENMITVLWAQTGKKTIEFSSELLRVKKR
jgi:hypothetical protein